MMKYILAGFTALFLLAASALAADTAPETEKPVLKLLKKKPGDVSKKRLVLRDGKRRVLVKVKKVPFETETLVARSSVDTSSQVMEGETNTTDSGAEYEEYVYVDDDNQPLADLNTSGETIEYVVFADEPGSEPEEEPTFVEETPAKSPKKRPPLPSHFMSVSMGSVTSTVSTQLYTVANSTIYSLQPGDHTFTADGSAYNFSSNESYTAIAFSYVYRTGMPGHGFHLTGYYDDHVAEAQVGYHFIFPDLLGFYPGFKLHAGVGYKDANEYRPPDAYAGGFAFLLERRVSDNFILGLEAGVNYRDWLRIRDVYGKFDQEDQESTLLLNLSYGFL